MNGQILCALLATRIPPTQFQVQGEVVVFMDAQYDTMGNRAIVADVVADYAVLAPAYVNAEEKALVLVQAKELRERIFSRLNGIQLDYAVAGNNPAGVTAIAAAKVGLKAITTHATVVAATTGTEATAALKAQYAALVAALYVADEYSVSAFNGLDV